MLTRAFTLRLRSLLSTAKPELQKEKINLTLLEQQFLQHFKKEYKKYEIPLLEPEGFLSYTSRFTKTVINLEYNQDERREYFILIKNSLNSDKKFTLQSCIDMCESFTNFNFQGQQNKIMTKIRDFAKANERILSGKKADRFIRAHRYLMLDKADGPIKFKDMKLNSSKTQRQIYEERFKQIFKKEKITQFQIDWIGKKQLVFQVELYGVRRTIKMIALDENKYQDEQIQVTIKKIREICKKQKDVIIINSDKQQQGINPKLMAQKLLTKQQLYDSLPQAKPTDASTYTQKLLKRLIQTYGPQYIKVSTSDNISHLNYVLENNTNDELQQIFGYAKLNMFHIQYQKIMQIMRARQMMVSSLQPLRYTSLFEQPEQDYYKIITKEQINAKALINLLQASKNKRQTIFCSQTKIPALLHNIFKLLKAPIADKKAIENRQPPIIMNKLALASVLYQIPVELPAISPNISTFRQLLHPITYPYRLKA